MFVGIGFGINIPPGDNGGHTNFFFWWELCCMLCYLSHEGEGMP